MTWMRLAALPLAAAMACTFDGTGLFSAGPPDEASSSSAGSSGSSNDTTTADPTTTTTAPDTTTSSTTLTTEPITSSSGEPATTSTTTEPGSTGSSSTGGPTCGDGLVEGSEACDTTDLGGQTCDTLGFPGGTLNCTAECTLDITQCKPKPACGDGTVDPGEDCDGDVGMTTCKDLGFDVGQLACTDCKFDTAGCKGVPADWYDPKYLKRRKLTITKDKLKGVLTDFPVVWASADMALNAALAPAAKLEFAGPDKKQLSHELEIDEAGRLIVWVELSLDAAADEVFYVYYGNPAPPPDTEDLANTWSNKFLGVWHLDEPVVDEMKGGKHADSTGSGHDGIQSDNQGVDTDCRIGPCTRIGSMDWIDFAKPAEFKLGNADATVAVWFKGNTKAACSLFAKSNAAMASDAQMILGARADGRLSFEQLGGGKQDADTDIVNDQWHYVVWTQTKDDQGSQDRWRLYVDAVEVKNELFSGKAANDAHTARLGGPTAGSNFPNDCEGRYDEAQISLAARSADWIVTAFKNQGAPTTFVTVGPEEAL